MLLDKENWQTCSVEIEQARSKIAGAVYGWSEAKKHFENTRALSPVIHPRDYIRFYPLVYRESLCFALVKMAKPPAEVQTFEQVLLWVYVNNPSALMFAGW